MYKSRLPSQLLASLQEIILSVNGKAKQKLYERSYGILKECEIDFHG